MRSGCGSSGARASDWSTISVSLQVILNVELPKVWPNECGDGPVSFGGSRVVRSPQHTAPASFDSNNVVTVL